MNGRSLNLATYGGTLSALTGLRQRPSSMPPRSCALDRNVRDGETGSLSVILDQPGIRGVDQLPELYLLVQGDRPLMASRRYALGGLRRVEIGRAASAREERRGDVLQLAVPDPRLSSLHVAIDLTQVSPVVEDLGSKNGTYVDGERVQTVGVGEGGASLEVGSTFFHLEPRRTVFADPDPRPRRLESSELSTFLPGLAETYAALADVAPNNLAILLEGESGTGKELVARVVHRLSGREGGFGVLDCASLMESAGLHAVDDGGALAAAEGGTLFLDAVGELRPSLQLSLLRLLEQRAPSTGSRAPRPFRPISASYVGMDRSAPLRSDFRARIATASFELPSLRQRRCDFGLVLQSILRKLAPDPNTLRIRRRALRALIAHDWPGNVRELESTIEYALIRAQGPLIELEHLPNDLASGWAPSVSPSRLETTSVTPSDAQVEPKGTGLEISVLGPLEVLHDGQPVTLPPSKKVRALLAFLACSDRPHRRERLSEIFCHLADDARAALRWQLSRLRPALRVGAQTFLEANRDEVRFLAEGTRVDLRILRQGLATLEAQPLEKLDNLACLFRGRFLEGLSLPDCAELEAWRVALEEETLSSRVRILRMLLAKKEEDPVRVLPHARTLLSLTPDDRALGLEVEHLKTEVRRTLLAGK